MTKSKEDPKLYINNNSHIKTFQNIPVLGKYQHNNFSLNLLFLEKHLNVNLKITHMDTIICIITNCLKIWHIFKHQPYLTLNIQLEKYCKLKMCYSDTIHRSTFEKLVYIQVKKKNLRERDYPFGHLANWRCFS